MAFKATLIMDQQKTSAAEVEAYSGKKYELVECEYEFYSRLTKVANHHPGHKVD